MGPPFLTVLLVSDDQRIAGTLRLAADLCIGIGAFFVTPTGVQTFISPFMGPDDGPRRVEALAESCLLHPGSRGRAIFWNAEDADQVGSVDRSLACVVVPAWAGEQWVGLLGVVDVWLPELDDEQRTGLIALAARTAAVTQGVAAGAGAAPAPVGVRVAAEPQVDDGGGHLAGWTAPAYLPEDEPPGADQPSPAEPGPSAGEAGVIAPPVTERPVTEPPVTEPPVTEPPAIQPAAAGRAAAGWVDEPARSGGQLLSEPFLGEVLDNLPDGLVVTRSDGAIVLVNQTFTTLSGLDIDDVLGEDVAAIISDEGHLPATPGPGWMDDVLGRPEPGQSVVIARRSGEPLAVGASGRRISSRFAGDCFVTLVRPTVDARTTGAAAGAPSGSVAVRPVESSQVADVPGAVPFQELLDNLDIGIVCCDVTGTVVLANRMARELQGVPVDRPMVGLPFPDTTDLRSPQGELVARDDHPLFRALHHGTPDAAHFVRGNDEGGTHIAITARPVLVGGRSGAIAVLRDVTAEWEEQVNLAHHAFHDPLTEVANRYLLIETLVRMLHGLSRRGGAVLLVFLDLDQFKRINDEHGHEVGDQVLTAVARRLQGVVRSDDIVSRLGGDEFVVAHVSQERTPDGDVVVARIRKALSAPYQFGGLIVDVGVSVGWVSTSSSEVTPEYLLSQADDKMYRNKRQRAGTGRSPDV